MVKAMNFFIRRLKHLLPWVLVAWCVVLLAQKIDLTTADLGRHLKNGEVLIHSSWHDEWQLLHTNFYSYTEPNQPFVNHHWLSGVIFYLIHQLAGFEGLSVFYVVIVAAAFYLFYRMAEKSAGRAVAAGLAILVLPLIASRAEVRPEGFTYVLMALFYWLLWRWKQAENSQSSMQHAKQDDRTDRTGIGPIGQIKKHRGRLFLLPILMLFWVNLHIGFIFGFLILGAFWLESMIQDSGFMIQDSKSDEGKKRFKQISLIVFLCVAAGMVNPFGIHGLLYPLNIFRQYGYMIVENQSVMFLQRLGMGSDLYFGLFKVLLVLAGLSFIVRLIKQRRQWKGFPFHEFLLLGSASVLSFLAIRNFPVFGLLFLPITASNIKAIMPESQHPAYKIMPTTIAVILVLGGSFRFWENYQLKQASFGLGLLEGVNASADFYRLNRIAGPVFNNYDIGGYLIYHLIPGQKAFVDNRPEAYSVAFFQKVYIPAQQDSAKWQELDTQYQFNAIFFSHRDYTPWGQQFLISRVQDPNWAPVFADGYNIIFLKRNERNAEIIKRFEISKEMFQIIRN